MAVSPGLWILPQAWLLTSCADLLDPPGRLSRYRGVGGTMTVLMGSTLIPAG